MAFVFVVIAFLLGVWVGVGWSAHGVRKFSKQSKEWQSRYEELYDLLKRNIPSKQMKPGGIVRTN